MWMRACVYHSALLRHTHTYIYTYIYVCLMNASIEVKLNEISFYNKTMVCLFFIIIDLIFI